jgi:hypothetical protein
MTAKEAKKAAQRAKLLAGIDKHVGPEPRPADIKTQLDIRLAYNWYNYSCTHKEFMTWIYEYMKNHGYSQHQISRVKSLPDWRISSTVGAICRMLNNGVTLPQDTIQWAHTRIVEYISKGEEPKKAAVVQIANTRSIADRVNEKTTNIIGDIEQELDLFFDKYDTKFNPYEYMKKNDVKAVQAVRVANYYNPLQQELRDVLTGKDAQLKEGYAHLSKPQLRKYMDFVDKIISDAESIAQVKKATRKSRKPKEKSSTQLTNKMKYLAESAQYKIASVDPTRIIKSQMLIVFNTKYKKLGVYVANDSTGLSVKGTTITNYDAEKSISKTLRKPEEVLPSTLANGKLAFNKMFNGLKTAASPLNGRINEDTILVRIL